MADAGLHTLTFQGELTERGFWLYVWKIDSTKGERLYVGRTGDSSSTNASSPFARMGRHQDPKGTANMLHKHLHKQKLDPKACIFTMVAYGPLFREEPTDAFTRRRDVVAALEKGLASSLRCGGHSVLNSVHSKKPLCWSCWQEVLPQIQNHFCRIALDPRPPGTQDWICDSHGPRILRDILTFPFWRCRESGS